jgi:hypothetical protein
VFRKGHVADASKDVPPDCGCPVLPAVKRAEATEPSPQRRGDAEGQDQKPGVDAAASAQLAQAQPTARNEGRITEGGIEVESPFVFHADPNVPDPPVLAIVRLSDRGKVLAFRPVVLPPNGTKVAAEGGNPQNRTFLGRLRSFFTTIFK